MASNNIGVVDDGNFQLFQWLFLQIKPALLYTLIMHNMQPLVGFSLIPKCMTMNGPEKLFHVKFWFVCWCEISYLVANACVLSAHKPMIDG